MPICKTCGNSFPTWVKVGGERKSMHSRINCLDCVPFGARPKHYYSKNKDGQNKICTRCNQSKDTSEFYKAGRGGFTHYCKSCNKKISNDRRLKDKIKAVELLGGKCSKCGYDKCYDAFDFHHVSSDEKSFNLNKFGRTSWSMLEKELKKCVLLCANCHREEHANERSFKYKEESG